MKTIMKGMGVLFLSMIVMNASGQQRMGMRNADPEEQAKQQIEQMKEIIELKNNKEEKAVKEVFVKYNKQRRDSFSSMQQGNPGANREKMQQIINKQNEELKKILGEERFTVYDEKMEEIRQNRRRRN
ncbi:MAG: hypothetical protein U5K32_12800 [Bacteroidales bacterium]|nr:hypothetical protein [Bacteroidales bacterium]